jgi:hypothetical protein
METIVPYAVYLVLAIVVMGALAIVLFGIRNLTYGKVNPVTVALSSIPVVIMIILGFVMGDWAVAAIWTVLITLVLTTASLLLSSFRGLIG